MSRVELESFLKSFLLFFSSLGVLIATLFYINYTKEVQTLDEKILSEMRVCSFDLRCDQFKIDFISFKEQKLYTLYKDDSGLTSYYPIPNSDKNILSFKLNQTKYNAELQKLQKDALANFFIYLGVILILSILFSIYALYPLRNALLLTQEFIKDILHDFNTPLASLRLNTSMLKREIGPNEKIARVEQSVENILNLQEHLKSYLHNFTMQQESFSLKKMIETQVRSIEKNYPSVTLHIDVTDVKIDTNKEAFVRIIENLLTNACKYNKTNGSVTIIYNQDEKSLKIQDTGKGIKNPTRIFERFYKEQERGIGIGLHIVKKLCDELGISITLESELNKGSTFTLSLWKLIHS